MCYLLAKRIACRLIGALLLIITLTGCYFPIRFDIEVDVSREGFYKLVFDGYVVNVPLYKGLRDEKIDSTEEQRKVAKVRTDITRDSAVSEFQYYNKGRFKVHWEKKGDITRQKFVTFMRRNAAFFSIKYNKLNYTIELSGTSLSKSQKKQLSAIGLGMIGEIRIKTDARVISNNATEKGTPTKFYIWKINGMNKPTPKMVISLM